VIGNEKGREISEKMPFDSVELPRHGMMKADRHAQKIGDAMARETDIEQLRNAGAVDYGADNIKVLSGLSALVTRMRRPLPRRYSTAELMLLLALPVAETSVPTASDQPLPKLAGRE
jgi:hypothetical protein